MPTTRGIATVALLVAVLHASPAVRAQEDNGSPGGFVIQGLQAQPVAEPVELEAIPRF